jgi:hypothetical protein
VFENRYRWNEMPTVGGSGVYALYADAPDALFPVSLGPENLVYVGMTEDSLDVRNHFIHEHSGFSSPRRSLGAILKQRLRLTATPRGPGASRSNVTCYRFAGQGETVLTDWMRQHLRLAIEPLTDAVRATEKNLIATMEPPLCLIGWQNPQKRTIRAMRDECKAEALRSRSGVETGL